MATATASLRSARRDALAVCLALAVGIAITAFGLYGLSWPTVLPWSRLGALRFALTLAGCAIAVFACARLVRLGPIGASLCVGAGLLVGLGAFASLAAVAVALLAFVTVGAALRRAVGDRGEDVVVDGLVGAGAYGTLIGVLAFFPVAHVATYGLLVAIPLVLDRRRLLLRIRSWGLATRDARQTPAIAWLACAVGVVHLLVALMPEMGYDALAMHHYIGGWVAARREWHFDPIRISWAVMPMLVDWLYAIMHVFDGPRAARLLNVVAITGLAAVVSRLAREAGASLAWSWFAAALLLSTPLVFGIGASLFVDAGWSALSLASVLLLLRPLQPDVIPAHWITAGALAGFAAAAKAVTLPMLPLLAILVLVQHGSLRAAPARRALGLALLAFAVGAAAPYLTAAMVTGNPFYPFFVHWFGGPSFEHWRIGPENFSEPLRPSLPYSITFESRRFIEGSAGSAGFQWMALLPAAVVALALARHRRGLALLGLGSAAVALVFVFTAYLRYAIPGLALLVAAIAVAGSVVSHGARLAGTCFAATAIAILGLNFLFYMAAASYRSFPLDTVASANRARSLVESQRPSSIGIEIADRLSQRQGRLALFGLPYVASAPGAEFVTDSWHTPAFKRAFDAAATPSAVAASLVDARVSHVVMTPAMLHPETVRKIERATVPVTSFRDVLIRRPDPSLAFPRELLRSGDFASLEGWTAVGTVDHDAAARFVRVLAGAAVMQHVDIEPRGTYYVEVRSRCPWNGETRVQVDWSDAGRRMIHTSMWPLPCTPDWESRGMMLFAPPHAALASVRVLTPSATPIEIDALSFRAAR